MHQYKHHPIHGIALSGPGKLWRLRGLVFDPDSPTKEIKCLECPDLICINSKEAKEHALKLCKTWIDTYRIH